ncbi:MAG: MerR family transcriptional regulator [Desulfovibrionaceae bacterium]|nr:MerR family transcriptional regulator [Desulfovibrionaceae bacterium]
MEKTYTHKDLARQLKVSETTVKSYRRKFPGCIPVSSQGKPIRFNAQALAVAKKIRDLFEQGMSVEEVRLRLSEEFSWIEPASGRPSVMPVEEAEEAQSNANDNFALSPSFVNAISGLAKSVVSLTRQQGEILDRLCSLEENLKSIQPAMQTQAEMPVEGGETALPESSRPAWAGELYSRIQDMEENLVRTLGNLEAGLSSQQPGEPFQNESVAAQSGQPAPCHATESATIEPEGPKVLPWGDRSAAVDSGIVSPSRPAAYGINDDYLRQAASLPLVVSLADELMGISGRGPFSLNDLKAVLSQIFLPPHHYVGRWETASGELWYLLEQPEEANAETISLLLKPATSRKNKPLMEVARFMLGGVNKEPSSLYTLVQQLLG